MFNIAQTSQLVPFTEDNKTPTQAAGTTYVCMQKWRSSTQLCVDEGWTFLHQPAWDLPRILFQLSLSQKPHLLPLLAGLPTWCHLHDSKMEVVIPTREGGFFHPILDNSGLVALCFWCSHCTAIRRNPFLFPILAWKSSKAAFIQRVACITSGGTIPWCGLRLRQHHHSSMVRWKKKITSLKSWALSASEHGTFLSPQGRRGEQKGVAERARFAGSPQLPLCIV